MQTTMISLWLTCNTLNMVSWFRVRKTSNPPRNPSLKIVDSQSIQIGCRIYKTRLFTILTRIVPVKQTWITLILSLRLELIKNCGRLPLDSSLAPTVTSWPLMQRRRRPENMRWARKQILSSGRCPTPAISISLSNPLKWETCIRALS